MIFLQSLAIMLASSNVSLSGAVYDMSLNPLKGVKVTIQSSSGKISDTTNVDGTWQLNGEIVSANRRISTENIKYKNGEIIVYSTTGGLVSVDLFGVNGAIRSNDRKNVISGEARFKLKDLSRQTLVRVSKNGILMFEGALSLLSNSNHHSIISSRAMGELGDSLIYSYNGWIRAKSPLGSYVASGIIQKIDLLSPSLDSIKHAKEIQDAISDSLRLVAKHLAESLNVAFVKAHPESKQFIDSISKLSDSLLASNNFTLGTEKSTERAVLSIRKMTLFSMIELQTSDSLKQLVDLLSVSDSTDSSAIFASPSSWAIFFGTIILPNTTKIAKAQSSSAEIKTRAILSYLGEKANYAERQKIVTGESYFIKMSNGKRALIKCNALEKVGPKNTLIAVSVFY